MQVTINNPQQARFVAEQIEAGVFESEEAAVAAALDFLMNADRYCELTDDEVAAIKEAEKEFERGEGIDFETVKRDLNRKYGVG